MRLDDLLAEQEYPHRASIAYGTAKIEITYRDPRDGAQARIEAAVGDDLRALGLDPTVTLTELRTGRKPVGEERIAAEKAVDALDTAGVNALVGILEVAEGAAIADVIGTWSLEDAVTPETCARLPASVRRAILELLRETVAPSEKLAFLAKSPRP